MGDHPLHNGQGLMRALRAAKCSIQGLKAAWQNESAFRQEVALACLFIPLGLWLGETMLAKLFLLSTVVLVLIVEIINSAIEAAIDRVGDEFHELSGRAKDLGSAAVFVALVFSGLSFFAIAADRFFS